ncbi:hypothetical protein [Nemorincola caseinilytica]
MDTSNNLPKDIVDKIMIQAEIDSLLAPLEIEEDRFDPLSLKPIPRFDESKFINGIKKTHSAEIPMKKAYKDKFISEVNVIGMKDGRLNGLYLTDEPYIKVDIPGNYYIATKQLIHLLKEFEANEYIVPYNDGLELVKLFCIDKQLLLDNCEIK